MSLIYEQNSLNQVDDITAELMHYLQDIQTKSMLWYKNKTSYQCNRVQHLIQKGAKVDFMDGHMVDLFMQSSDEIRQTLLLSPEFQGYDFHKKVASALSISILKNNIDFVDTFLNVMRLNNNAHHKILNALLKFTIEKSHVAGFDYLIEKTDVDVNFKLGETQDNMLIHLIKTQNFDAFKHLLDSNKIEIKNVNELRQSPVIVAAMLGQDQFLQALLERDDVHMLNDLNAPDRSGKNALQYSAERGHFNCVKLLLADSRVDIFDERVGCTDVMLTALNHGHELCAKEVYKHLHDLITDQHDFNQIVVSAYRYNNQACADYFIDQTTTDKQKSQAIDVLDNYKLVESFKFNQAVFDKNPELYLTKRYGPHQETALMLAVKKEDEACVRYILTDPKVDLKEIDNRGMSAIEHANYNVFAMKSAPSAKRLKIKTLLQNALKRQVEFEKSSGLSAQFVTHHTNQNIQHMKKEKNYENQ